jgi:hypothetical protein
MAELVPKKKKKKKTWKNSIDLLRGDNLDPDTPRTMYVMIGK